jgi:hypothetical protein
MRYFAGEDGGAFMPIYFLQSAGSVKIGFSSRIKNRIEEIKTANHKKLKLLAIQEGTVDDEGRLHRQFSKDRIRGEWFRLSPALRSYIASLPPPPLAMTSKDQQRCILFDAEKLRQKEAFLRINQRDVMYLSGMALGSVLRNYLISLAETFQLANGMTLNYVSKRFYGHTYFFERFRDEKCSISIDRYDAVVQKFEREWPKGVYFPRLPKIYLVGPRRRKGKEIPAKDAEPIAPKPANRLASPRHEDDRRKGRDARPARSGHRRVAGAAVPRDRRPQRRDRGVHAADDPS